MGAKERLRDFFRGYSDADTASARKKILEGKPGGFVPLSSKEMVATEREKLMDELFNRRIISSKMKFTEEQNHKFTQYLVNEYGLEITDCGNLLMGAIEWIAANLKPEEVFTHDQVLDWAKRTLRGELG